MFPSQKIDEALVLVYQGVLADKPFLTFLLIFIPIGFWAAKTEQPDMVHRWPLDLAACMMSA